MARTLQTTWLGTCRAGLVAGLFAVLMALPATAHAVAPRAESVKPAKTSVGPGYLTERISVKFRDDSGVRARGLVLTDLGNGALLQARPLLAKELAGGKWRPLHPDVPEAKLDEWRQTAQRSLGKAVADLNTQTELELPPGMDAATACDLLNALDIVEIAEPMPAPMEPPLPPSYESSQSYLQAPTTGIGAFDAWNVLAATGAGVKIADVEYSWNSAHQDLPTVTLIGPTPVDPFNDNNHGTAVIGELAAKRNGWGTTGGAHNATIYFSAANTSSGYNVATAITRVLSTLGPGDVILIEQQIAGPLYTGSPPGTQTGLVPVEWFSGYYNAIVTAVGNGITVVEAAGNGSQNLDSSTYSTGNGGHWPFLPQNDSGAIIVGAGAAGVGGSSTARSRLWFSNYGSTVDLQGWGESVVTTGYGDRYQAEGVNLRYTSTFSGTSSASPIVASACALLQEAYKDRQGTALLPAAVKLTLRQTGSPQTSGGNPASQNIGPLPNVAAALGAALGSTTDCDANGIPDAIEIAADSTLDCNQNGTLDRCEPWAVVTSTLASTGDAFGTSVAVDGDVLVVGAPNDDDMDVDSGAAYVFHRIAGEWTFVEELVAYDGQSFELFGSSVGVSGDTIVVGAPNTKQPAPGAGAIYIFTWNGSTYGSGKRVNAPDAAGSDAFGTSVGIEGNRIVVGAPSGDVPGFTNAGKVYLLEKTASQWSAPQEFHPADASADAAFGTSVAIRGSRVIVGAPNDDQRAFNAGAAYIYELGPSGPTLDGKVVAADGQNSDSFGNSVALDIDRAVVGANRDDDLGSSSGSAYIFDRVGGSWTQAVKLTRAGGHSADNFGISVAVRGDAVLVGAYLDDIAAADAGATLLFGRNSAGVWSLNGALGQEGATAGDQFGRGVAMDDEHGVAGLPLDDVGTSDSGSARVFAYHAYLDCNANGLQDLRDISCGTSADANGNFRPDECEAPPACPGDTNGDQQVDGADLSVLLGQFNASVAPGSGGDLNGDGVVNGADLSVLLGRFGISC